MVEQITHINEKYIIDTPEQKDEIFTEIMLGDSTLNPEIISDSWVRDELAKDKSIWVGVNREEIKTRVRNKIDKLLKTRASKIERLKEPKIDKLKAA